MAEAVETQELDALGNVDIDCIFQGGFPDDLDFDLDLSPELWLPDIPTGESDSPNSVTSEADPPPMAESNTPDSLSSFATEIEKFLMDDRFAEEGDGGEHFDDEFFSSLFVDGSESGKSEVATPESDAPGESDEKEKRDASVLVDGEEGHDPISKKRRRQMRNRDSAMKSRERKKMYVKDLEMKSKYLESECRRLNYALQCCVAENMALHQRLQKDRPLGVPTAKQESAVLFVESLLLGSLFWLVSIVCLFLVPGQRKLNQKEASGMGRGLTQEAVGPQRVANNKLGPDLGIEFVIMRRRCRGMRARMKSFLFPLHAVSA